MNLLALDYGTKNIGIARYDAEVGVSWALKSIKNTNQEQVAQELARLVDQYEIGTIIVGLPLDKDGNETSMSQEVKHFTQNISQTLRTPVDFANETLTTKHAHATFNQHRAKLKDKDSESARIILQDYLQTHG